MSRPRKSKSTKKAVKPVFLIYTEGEATEINYLEAYIQDYVKSRGYFGPRIKVQQPKKYKPKDLLESALENRVSGDSVWIVFDCDDHPEKDKVFQSAEENGIKIAYSNFCFEEWLLLHYGYTAAAYSSCNSLKAELKKHLKKDYEKGEVDLFAEIAGKDNCNVTSARRSARKLCQTMQETHPDQAVFELNPYTNVYELLDAIDAFIEKTQRYRKESPGD